MPGPLCIDTFQITCIVSDPLCTDMDIFPFFIDPCILRQSCAALVSMIIDGGYICSSGLAHTASLL